MRVKKILIISMLLMLISTITISAKDFNIKTNIPYNKVWTVKFNNEVDWKTVEQGITIIDSKGYKVKNKFTIGEGGDNIVILPPIGGYKPLESYTILVKNVITTRRGTNLKEESKFKFTISNKQPVKDEVYNTDFAEVFIDYYNDGNLIKSKVKGTVIDNKVVTTYQEMNKADSAIIKTTSGLIYDVDGVYYYDKLNNLAVLKVNSNKLLSVDSERIDRIKIGNQFIYNDTLSGILKNPTYRSLLEIRKENNSNMNLSQIELYLYKKYLSYSIGNYTAKFSNVFLLENERIENSIDVYFVLNEMNFEEQWKYSLLNNVKYKENIEQILTYVYNDISNQFPDKKINIMIITDYSSKDNIADFKEDEGLYNQQTNIWNIRVEVLYFTKINQVKYCKWNEKF